MAFFLYLDVDGPRPCVIEVRGSQGDQYRKVLDHLLASPAAPELQYHNKMHYKFHLTQYLEEIHLNEMHRRAALPR
jgi:hypothetical protein